MKRETQANNYEITSCNPWFFWKECLFCNGEFRREPGYRFCISRSNGIMFWSYSCAECSDSKEKVEKNIKSMMTKRPKASCAPPPRNP